MKKCLQYFWPFLWPNVSAMVVFEAVVVVLAFVSGVPQGQEGIFATYFYSMPLLILLFLFMYSVSLTTATLNLAIAMGGTRRTYFQGMQLILVVYALIGWGLILLMPLIPQMGNWVPNQRLHLLLLVSGQYGPLYPPFLSGHSGGGRPVRIADGALQGPGYLHHVPGHSGGYRRSGGAWLGGNGFL